MGDALSAAAQGIRLPNDIKRTATDYGVCKIAVTTTASSHRLPADFSGRFVHLYPDTAGVFVQVAGVAEPLATLTTSKAVDIAAANSAAGATSLTAGQPLVPQAVTPVQLPKWDKNENGFLIFDSSGSCTLYVWIASGY